MCWSVPFIFALVGNICAFDAQCVDGHCEFDEAASASSMLQRKRSSVSNKQVSDACGVEGGCLYTAWDVDYVESACGSKSSLLQFNESSTRDEPWIPHWTARRFRVDPSDTGTMLYYGSADIQEHVPNVATIAVVSFHGAKRNAIDYFCNLRNIMAKQSGYDLPEVLMITLKFTYKHDLAEADSGDDDPGSSQEDEDYEDEAFEPASTDLWWNGSKKEGAKGDYRQGAHSDEDSGGFYSSFDIIDRVVLALEKNSDFPNLREIVLMGHSAGGQTVQRYALTTRLETPRPSGVKIRYAVANPSTVAYLNDKRFSYDCDSNGCTTPVYEKYRRSRARYGWEDDGHRRRAIRRRADSQPEDRADYGVTFGRRRHGEPFAFHGVDPISDDRYFLCNTGMAHDWHYALFEDTDPATMTPYVRDHPGGIAQMHAWYKERDIVYLAGQRDTCTDDLLPGGYCDPDCWLKEINYDTPYHDSTCYRNRMDMTCGAMLQGWNRKLRLHLYMEHLADVYGEPVHQLFKIEGVGHEGEAMFLDSDVLEFLFPGLAGQHDSNACMRGNPNNPTPDPDCCSWHGFCAEGYQTVQTASCGLDNSYCQKQEAGCKSVQCIPDPPSHASHDASKCRKWNGDEGCCSAAGGSCVDGYEKVVMDRCGIGNDWCDQHGCWTIMCFPPS